MYPKAFMFMSFFLEAWFPQVLESSFSPPVPNPTLELQEVQSSSSLPRMPILALIFGADFPGALDIEPFFVTAVIKGGTRGNQWKPRATTQWSKTVFSVSDQWMQGTGALVDLNKIDLVVDLHTEANFGERCVPVGGKFGLLRVKPSLSAVNVKGFIVLPKWRIVVKICLLEEYY